MSDASTLGPRAPHPKRMMPRSWTTTRKFLTAHLTEHQPRWVEYRDYQNGEKLDRREDSDAEKEFRNQVVEVVMPHEKPSRATAPETTIKRTIPKKPRIVFGAAYVLAPIIRLAVPFAIARE